MKPSRNHKDILFQNPGTELLSHLKVTNLCVSFQETLIPQGPDLPSQGHQSPSAAMPFLLLSSLTLYTFSIWSGGPGQACLAPGIAHVPPSGLMVIKKFLIMSTLAPKCPAFLAPLCSQPLSTVPRPRSGTFSRWDLFLLPSLFTSFLHVTSFLEVSMRAESQGEDEP